MILQRPVIDSKASFKKKEPNKEPNLSSTFSARPEFDYAPQFVSFNFLDTLPVASQLPSLKVPTLKTKIFLDHYSSQGVVCEYPVKTKFNLKNDTDFALLNLTLIFRDSGKTVFSTSSLSPQKTISLSILQSGFFDLHFRVSFVETISKATFKIFDPTDSTHPNSENFGFNLKPKWFI
jgi:hypothetical protein